ncbi:Glycoside hydrolase, catalytic domain-containing protein [Cynara cardunculus var. scolymus]|uniref:Glycoside hydrolase, catalytic domain-containing protein n=1 Tax=Cynara cardunculus var. scolymus TaxID=59895 RepID=A0A118JU33_CYNCS|nr:Glycoside hydrolase, catalytic domain-containing protein [Cynara cardunculus var. scolymus]
MVELQAYGILLLEDIPIRSQIIVMRSPPLIVIIDTRSDFSNNYRSPSSFIQKNEDVRMVKQMGMDAYRFSISWSRILPRGKLSSGINEHGISYYNNLINELRSNDLEPFVTLFHWDLPQALEDEYGGFLSSRVVNDFRDFAELCFRRFGDRVKFWITLNEPWSYSVGGYEKGYFAPGRCSYSVANCTAGDSGIEPYIVTHNLLLAHAAAVKLFMNPLTFGEYPETMRINVANRLPQFTAEESYTLRNSLDFLGLNYYTANYVQHIAQAVTDNMTRSSDSQTRLSSTLKRVVKYTSHLERNGVPIGSKVLFSFTKFIFRHNIIENESKIRLHFQGGTDWLRAYPQGIHDLLVYIKNNYNNPTIYVTENGVDEPNNASLSLRSVLQDDFRVQYYFGHLQKLLQAIKGECEGLLCMVIDGQLRMGSRLCGPVWATLCRLWQRFETISKVFVHLVRQFHAYSRIEGE